MLNYQTRLDTVFHALSDPTRRAIVDRLIRGPASVSQLAAPLDMTLSAVVQHLQVLEESGLVGSDKIGRVRTCRIEPAVLRTVEHWISGRRTSWERHFDRLGEYLAATEPPEQTAEVSAEGSERGRDSPANRPERGTGHTPGKKTRKQE
jgi:DNA-binding transcriptional ArsR family regulator